MCSFSIPRIITHTHLAPRTDAEASLMDACIAENDEQLANEIGDLLLSKNLSLVHEAKGSPVFELSLFVGMFFLGDTKDVSLLVGPVTEWGSIRRFFVWLVSP